MRKTVFKLVTALALLAIAIVFTGFNPVRLFQKGDTGKSTFIATVPRQKPGKLGYQTAKQILDNRCATCHSGLDAPCQLQLTSYDGIRRGASKQALFALRLDSIPPTRLDVDGKSVDDWRAKSFFPVLNEKAQFPEINLNNAVLAKMLAQKRNHPAIDPGTTTSGECPTLDEFASFAQNRPGSGMPYALPQLTASETETLLQWLQDGAKNSVAPAPSEAVLAEIAKWEQFLNEAAPATQLTARYLYEHWFTAHLHFQNLPDPLFFHLVRSKTPPGEAIALLATAQPFNPPNSGSFYYRLQPINETLSAKDHAVYELSDTKLARIKTLFLTPEVAVSQLPGYNQLNSADPFTTFKDLPVAARQQFLLDDALYFFTTLFQSPALTHHDGLSGLQEHFWVAFLKPQPELETDYRKFFAQTAPYLRLPAANAGNANFSEWFELKALAKHYQTDQEQFIRTVLNDQAADFTQLWQGDGGAAMLTVFRHDDYATALKGRHGTTPQSAWVVDYALFERLYYLLVAGFDPYGNTFHHLNTRLMLDLLRSEAENRFLQFVPKAERAKLHARWYPGVGSGWLGVFHTPDFSNQAESAIAYQSDDYVSEFFGQLPQTAGEAVYIPACTEPACPPKPAITPEPPRYPELVEKLNTLAGLEISALPEVSFLLINNRDTGRTTALTLMHNRHLRHVAMLVGEKLRHEPENDSLTVLPGLIGAYPNQIFALSDEQITDFIQGLAAAQTESTHEDFFDRFAIRRNHPQFWLYFDQINQLHRDGHPEQPGLFALNRYR